MLIPWRVSRWNGSWQRGRLCTTSSSSKSWGSLSCWLTYERFGNGGVCLSKMTWWGWWVVGFLVQIYDIPQIQKWYWANVSCVDIKVSDTLLSWRRVTFKRKNTENETPTGPIGMLTIAKVLDKRHLYRSDNSHLRNVLQVSRFYQKLRTETQVDTFCKTRRSASCRNRHVAFPQKKWRTPCAGSSGSKCWGRGRGQFSQRRSQDARNSTTSGGQSWQPPKD